MYSMRKAFTRWLVLHDEEWRLGGRKSALSVPSWFGHEVRKRTSWRYFNKYEQAKRHRYGGHYEFYIDDEMLMNIERPKYKE